MGEVECLGKKTKTGGRGGTIRTVITKGKSGGRDLTSEKSKWGQYQKSVKNRRGYCGGSLRWAGKKGQEEARVGGSKGKGMGIENNQ